MKKTKVELVNIDEPIVAVGKTFFGDYSNTQKYTAEVQAILERSGTSIVPNKAMGVYYDNPQEKPAEELKSFQGAFLKNADDEFDSSLEEITIRGRLLHIEVSGDPMKSIYEGYNALFKYIQENKIALRSNAGFQISTLNNNEISTEIYMQVSI